jgi:hypothetical protein
MQSREGWERAEAGPKMINGREYKNLVEFRRQCGACAKLFSIFVTEKIASGKADSNSFGLRNCEEHRRSRTKTDGVELDALRTANVTMHEELTGLYALNKTQFEEIQALKARLALYELTPAMMVAELDAARLDLGQEQRVTTISSVLPKQFPWA